MDSVVLYYVYINNRVKPGMVVHTFILAEAEFKANLVKV